MKFGDLVMSVASIAVIFALITFPLDVVFVSALGLGGYEVGVFVSFFLSALIGGYIFARKIWEARRENITKITVLWAALVMLLAIIVPGGLAHWGLASEEEFKASYPDTTLSTAEWTNWEMMYLDSFMFLIVVISLVLGFVGLYVGSMLRRPAKS
ncbi:MAG: hypothetical protein OEW95_05755 [Candidatus Bathyarchaeota archaeon]|nr:hypothetical protein [Candidatus Bathyarchaeota archaeon]